MKTVSGAFSVNIVASPTPTPTPTTAWESVPYNPVTINYWDGRPVAQYVGDPYNRIAYGSKHTRSAYRPSTGRLYFGWGDHACGGTGLAEDQGSSSANPAFYSMDPANPSVVTMEQHRYPRTPNNIQPSALDEGAADWNTTSDRLLVASLDSFCVFNQPVYNNIANYKDSNSPLLIPKYISAHQFRLDGNDWTSIFPVGEWARIHLTHPSFPGYTIEQRNQKPCWIDTRITASIFSGGNTTCTFETRPDTPALAFTADGVGITSDIGDTQSYAGRHGCGWLDEGQCYFDPATNKYFCGLLEWNPTTRIWTKIWFQEGRRYQSGVDIGRALLYPAFQTSSNGVFVPASVTGRGDEFISLQNFGPDGGWFGAFVHEYNTRTFNAYIIASADAPSFWIANGITKDTISGYDTVGKRIYLYSAAECCVYVYEIDTRRLRVLVNFIPGLNDLSNPRCAQPGAGHTCWNADLGLIEVYADENNGGYATNVAGFGCPTLYLVNPSTLNVVKVGNTLPSGERLRGDEFYRAGSYTVADGGELNPDGTDGAPPNRHVFIGKNYTGSKP